MLFEEGKYYHLYNRSNNRELLFKQERNYRYFLKKFRQHCDPFFETIAFCLMPTHFHFLVRFLSTDLGGARKAIAILLSSYTKAINIQSKRQGSLFQPHTKVIEISDDSYFLTLVSYIHQNPVRAGIVNQMESWPHSSYKILLDSSLDAWKKNSTIYSKFKDSTEFRKFSEIMLESIRSEFWV
jgi:REP element-mobilizing transposase RayT